MKFTELVLSVVMISIVSLATTANAAATPKYYKGSLIHSNEKSVTVGGDEVIFGYKVTGCTVNSFKDAAIALKNRATTDRWDDQWYAFEVDMGKCLMIGWYDLTAHKYGWAGIQNQPNSWTTRTASRTWATLANGNQAKYSFTINGQRVDLDIFNPNNQGALTGNDILISFGY